MRNGAVIWLVLGGLVALAIKIRLSLDNWRKKSMTEAAKLLGFSRLCQGETLPVVMVPLLDSSRRKYFLILRGAMGGYEAAFFDLYIGAGDNWFYQSAVMVKNPDVIMPRFQLKPPDWAQVLRQRTCGAELKIPGREQDMRSLRLSGDNPSWTMQTFSRAAPQFLQKLRDGKWTIEGAHHSLVIYRWGKKIPAKKLQEHLEQAAQIAAETYALCC
jgi:hypothetical protein